ncbi:hypothetical protein C8F04DRAFT_1195113 [Mycena alexandri]|uniref:Uncharacterized protein n=1 Tax=Mycena alexandri TaxID=1745969 RepID=A0AAD6S716_9AGAR|nr:hypothetical protein C8F04DRAFT_1195113 [Mycena alexandri]
MSTLRLQDQARIERATHNPFWEIVDCVRVRTTAARPFLMFWVTELHWLLSTGCARHSLDLRGFTNSKEIAALLFFLRATSTLPASSIICSNSPNLRKLDDGGKNTVQIPIDFLSPLSASRWITVPQRIQVPNERRRFSGFTRGHCPRATPRGQQDIKLRRNKSCQFFSGFGLAPSAFLEETQLPTSLGCWVALVLWYTSSFKKHTLCFVTGPRLDSNEQIPCKRSSNFTAGPSFQVPVSVLLGSVGFVI